MRQFIGMGSGRCGTRSLAKLIGRCKNTYVTHEAFPSAWYKTEAPIGQLILGMKRGVHPCWPDARPGGLVGEVSCGLISHYRALREPIPDLKIVCMHRHKDEVVESFLRKTSRHSLRPCDRPQFKSAMLSRGLPDTPERLPIIDAATKEQSWGFYWEMCEEVMSKVKPPVKHVWMKSLNDDFTLKSIFEFLDIPIEDRVVSQRRVWNSSKE